MSPAPARTTGSVAVGSVGDVRYVVSHWSGSADPSEVACWSGVGAVGMESAHPESMNAADARRTLRGLAMRMSVVRRDGLPRIGVET